MAQHRSEILDLLSNYAARRAEAGKAARQERQMFTATLRVNLEAKRRAIRPEPRAERQDSTAPVSPHPAPKSHRHLHTALAKLAASVARLRDNMHRLGSHADGDATLATSVGETRPVPTFQGRGAC